MVAIATTGLSAVITSAFSGHGGAVAGARSGAAQERVDRTLTRLPVSFEQNQGQFDPEVRFVSRGSGHTLFLTPAEAVLALAGGNAGAAAGDRHAPAAAHEQGGGGDSGAVVRMRLEGANPAPELSGVQALPGTANHFAGDDPARWRTAIARYAGVRYDAVYPGIDAEYHGRRGEFEYDFLVAPGADAGVVTLAFEGAESVSLDGEDLVLTTAAGTVRQAAPVAYQEVGGQRRPVEARYVLDDAGRARFELGSYDTRLPLVIDPVVTYSTYLGGTANDFGYGVTTDAAGATYVAGRTYSAAFPGVAAGSVRGGSNDAVVAKLTSDGAALEWATYVGGGSSEVGYGPALDAAGNVYVAGFTSSTNFPTTEGALSRARFGTSDAFVTKLTPTGGLGYSTYLGGGRFDQAFTIQVDPDGHAYVGGNTESIDYPTTAGVVQSRTPGGNDGFLSKLSPDGTALVWSTYLGGAAEDMVFGLALDAASPPSVYATGRTISPDFPITLGAYQMVPPVLSNPFVAKLSPDATSLSYSTYLGGNDSDAAFGIALAPGCSGECPAYLTGSTLATDFPVTATAVQPRNPGRTSAWVARLGAQGATLEYSSYLGGAANDRADAIRVDRVGAAQVVGTTFSTDFPATSGTALSGASDAFVAAVDTTAAGAASLVFSTLVGGTGAENGFGIAVDRAGATHVTGDTTSNDLATSPGSPQPARSSSAEGGTDGFVVRLARPFTLGVSPPVQTVRRGQSVNYGVSVAGAGGPVQLSVSGLPAGATASFSANPTDPATGSSTLTISTAITVRAGTYTFTVTGTGAGVTRTATATLVVGPGAVPTAP